MPSVSKASVKAVFPQPEGPTIIVLLGPRIVFFIGPERVGLYTLKKRPPGRTRTDGTEIYSPMPAGLAYRIRVDNVNRTARPGRVLR